MARTVTTNLTDIEEAAITSINTTFEDHVRQWLDGTVDRAFNNSVDTKLGQVRDRVAAGTKTTAQVLAKLDELLA